MKILSKSAKIGKEELYEMMSPKESTNMRDLVGHELAIDKFVIHEDVDDFNTPNKILSVKTKEGGIVVSSSKSFIREFEKINLIFGKVNLVEVTSEITSNGYEVISCEYLK